MIRLAAAVLAIAVASQAQAEIATSVPTQDAVHRIDPAKTLKLIQRIRSAAGGGLVVS
jgi:hypothetical protein